jgi:beta-phosphoglucomutase family hydrolase
MKVHPDAQALIFDLDGTLSDSMEVHMAAWNRIGEKYGFKFDPQIYYEMTGSPTIEFARKIIETYNLTADPEDIVKIKQNSFWDSVKLVKPMKKVISIVKDYYMKLPMSVGTGASRKSACLQLAALGIKNYFDFIVSADDVEKHKPEPDTFLKCARLMNVDPRFCQVFEDGDLGIRAAKKAGMIITDVRPHIK